MSDEFFDPAEAFEDMDLENLEYGFTNEDLEEAVNSVRTDGFTHSGVKCAVEKKGVEIASRNYMLSSQKFWFACVEVDWPDNLLDRVQALFESEIWETDSGWIRVKVGHEHGVSRGEVVDEAEWLAEQVVMIENDPSISV